MNISFDPIIRCTPGRNTTNIGRLMIHKQQPITILSHNWIEMNIQYIKRRIEYKLNMKTCKKINDGASSSTLVEDLASHANKRQRKIKWKYYQLKDYN
jgi:hypothetical protein